MSAPEAFRSVVRKARKAHVCCECHKAINIGDQYQYSSGIWEGEPNSYKQCLGCHVIFEAATKRYRIAYDDDSTPYFGELRGFFLDQSCIGYQGETLLNMESTEIGIEPEVLNRLLKIEVTA